MNRENYIKNGWDKVEATDYTDFQIQEVVTNIMYYIKDMTYDWAEIHDGRSDRTVTKDTLYNDFKVILNKKILKFEPTHLNGKYYKTRGGFKVEIYKIHENNKYPIHGVRYKDKELSLLSWQEDGKYEVSCENADIVDYWKEPDRFTNDKLMYINGKWNEFNENEKSPIQIAMNELPDRSGMVYVSDDLADHVNDAMKYVMCYYMTEMNEKGWLQPKLIPIMETFVSCQHEWQEIPLLTSVKRNCKKCGCKEEKDV